MELRGVSSFKAASDIGAGKDEGLDDYSKECRAPVTQRTIPESTAKARGLAAMSSQMQTFVPNHSMSQAVQNSVPSVVAHNTVIEHFDLAADDNSSVSSWSLAQ